MKNWMKFLIVLSAQGVLSALWAYIILTKVPESGLVVFFLILYGIVIGVGGWFVFDAWSGLKR